MVYSSITAGGGKVKIFTFLSKGITRQVYIHAGAIAIGRKTKSLVLSLMYDALLTSGMGILKGVQECPLPMSLS